MVSPYSLSRPGGVQGQVLGLAAEMRRMGIDVRVLGPCDGAPPEPGIVSVGPSVNWDSNGSVAPIAAGKAVARRTIEALRSIDPDVVHLHEPAVPGPALTALIGFQGPMLGTFHISGEVAHAYLTPALRGFMNRLHARVAVSAAARENAETYYGGEYRVLWNAIDPHRYDSSEPWPSDRPAVLFVGRHEPRKGLEVLLRAWRGIDRDAVLWVVGSGPQTDELRRLGVPAVEWLGPLPDDALARRLRGASVFCAPSISGESFGIVLLEAMAARVPIVASAISGYSHVARADREALLVPPEDPDALRVALRRMLDDALLNDRLVEAGVARAGEFAMDRLAAEYVDCYRKVRTSERVAP